jgi:hypothetical protein
VRRRLLRPALALALASLAMLGAPPAGATAGADGGGPSSIAAVVPSDLVPLARPRGFVQVIGVRQHPGPTPRCTTIDVQVANRSDTPTVALTMPRVRTRIFNPMYPAAIGDGSLLFRDGPEAGPLTRSLRLQPFSVGTARFVVCVPASVGERGDQSVAARLVETGYRWTWAPGWRVR